MSTVNNQVILYTRRFPAGTHNRPANQISVSFYTLDNFRQELITDQLTKYHFTSVQHARKSPYGLHLLLSFFFFFFFDVSFETVPLCVRLAMALSRHFKEDRLVSHLSALVSSRRSMIVWCRCVCTTEWMYHQHSGIHLPTVVVQLKSPEPHFQKVKNYNDNNLKHSLQLGF